LDADVIRPQSPSDRDEESRPPTAGR
jgi:hypothetical protein